MKSERACRAARISYEKPTAVDLGPAAPIAGASCASGDFVGELHCGPVGNSDASHCMLTGNSAGQNCTQLGNSASYYCGVVGNSAFDCISGSTTV